MLRCLLALCLACCAWSAGARDLPRTDPQRQTLLDAARVEQEEYGDYRFVVKDLFRAGDFAYLCALGAYPDGSYASGSLDPHPRVVFKVLLIQDRGKWWLANDDESWATDFVGKGETVNCAFGAAAVQPQDEADLRGMVEAAARQHFSQRFSFLDIEHDDAARLARLRAHGLFAADLSIEHAKPVHDYAHAHIYMQNGRCAQDARCTRQNGIEAALHTTERDAAVSSLVWDGCHTLVDHDELGSLQECITQHRQRQECRPAMGMFHDRSDIARCAASLLNFCRKARRAGGGDPDACKFDWYSQMLER